MGTTRGWLFGTIAIFAAAAVAGAADYIGEAKCKMCHKTEHASWAETKHAGAFDLLALEDQAKGECLVCHATGGSVEMPGVQCESCHGPGSAYKSMKVMKDPGASLAAGLVAPDEATCRGCHEGAPHDQAAFDYEAAQATGTHASKKGE